MFEPAAFSLFGSAVKKIKKQDPVDSQLKMNKIDQWPPPSEDLKPESFSLFKDNKDKKDSDFK